MTSVLAHVIDSIAPASAAHAEGARLNVVAAGTPILERLAAILGGAQHTARPRAARRVIVVAAGDHGVGDPGVALGAAHPTVVAAHAIAGGTAALAHVARASRTPIVLVDAGAAERALMPATAVQLGRSATRDLSREPAMTIVDAAMLLEAGIALAVSLVDNGLDLLVIGALGIGAEVASAAHLGAAGHVAAAGRDPATTRAGAARIGADEPALATHARQAGPGGDAGIRDDEVASAAFVEGRKLAGASGLERLAVFGGAETGVLAGLMLGAASMNVPTILDSYATGSAALLANALQPNVRGYLVAAHAGTFTQRAIAHVLGLEPLFDVGLGHGEGTGAAMVIPLADQVAALAAGG